MSYPYQFDPESELLDHFAHPSSASAKEVIPSKEACCNWRVAKKEFETLKLPPVGSPEWVSSAEFYASHIVVEGKMREIFCKSISLDTRRSGVELNSRQRGTRASQRARARFGYIPQTPVRSSEFWRIMDHGLPEVPKPPIYSQRAFRAWVHGEATRLTKSITGGAHYVSGNSACERLYFGHSHSIKDDLKKARVYIESYKSHSRPTLQLADFMYLMAGYLS